MLFSNIENLIIIKFCQLLGVKMQDTELVLHIKNDKPVELVDFTMSMNAFANEYYAQTNHASQLYVKRLESGSIIATLLATAPQVLPFVNDLNTAIDFINHIKNCVDYLQNKTGHRPSDETLQNMDKFLEPIAKDSQASININVYGDHNHVNIDSLQANAMQNQIKRELQSNTPEYGIYTHQLLYFKQARADNKQGFKGIIESISPKELKVCFTDEHTWKAVTENHPFNYAYIVDVDVQTIDGKPKLYKILALHDIVDLDD